MSDNASQIKEKLIQDYQQSMAQLEMVQRQLLELRYDINDVTVAIKSLEGLPPEEPVYKLVGMLYFQDKASKCLLEKREKLETRKLSEERLKRQEKKLVDGITSLEQQLKQYVPIE